MATSVYALANSGLQVRTILETLMSNGFVSDDVSIIFPDRGSSKDFAHEKHTKATEVAVAGLSSGGLVGGALGLVAAFGTLAIPGAGIFLAAGPILTALSGAAVGAAVGGIAGALIGFGIPEYEAKRYEGKVHEGRILISVSASSKDQVMRATRILTDAGASDIASSEEWAVPQQTSASDPRPSPGMA